MSTSGLANVTATARVNSKSQDWWQKERFDGRGITQIVADICKFVTDECCHIGGKFFYAESELAMEEKCMKLRN